jgi:DNA repair protein RadC
LYPFENSSLEKPLTVKELPHEMRPREEFLRNGARNVPLDILLAILLRTGATGMNVVELAREMVRRLNGVEGLTEASFEKLRGLGIKGLGKVKCMELAAALEIGRRAAEELKKKDYRQEDPPLNTPENVYRLLAPLARNLRQEVFWTVLLNAKNRPIGRPVETMRGLLSTVPIHPREIFAPAVRHGAAAVILAHNHPTGDPAPSKEDLEVTRRLVEAARILGIRVTDHLIVGTPSPASPGYVSLRERGLAEFD